MGVNRHRDGVAGLLGRCPVCDADIPTRNLLIRYTAAGGWPTMFAACPRCDDVVHPR